MATWSITILQSCRDTGRELLMRLLLLIELLRTSHIDRRILTSPAKRATGFSR